jgi:ribonuclease BN (tRNA processing enzyme)
MFEELLHASDEMLLSILAEADALDEVIGEKRSRSLPSTRLTGDHSLEVIVLGSMGCRLGMLRGEVGGFLLKTGGVHMLVDPGPAAVYYLSRLEAQGQFRFGDLDAILCSHVHPDHSTDVVPCIEGMTGGMRMSRGYLIGNRTTIERIAAFSPYHLTRVQPTALMSDKDKVEYDVAQGEQDNLLAYIVDLDSIEVRATPTSHLEEEGKLDTGIGFLVQSQDALVWYTSDTSLFDGLLEYVKAQVGEQRLTLVVANADASDVEYRPGKAQICHLLTRDVLEIARELEPYYILIQHYDEAYSSPRYRIAQAIYLQRLVDRSSLETIILPSANGLCLSFDGHHLRKHKLHFESDVGAVVGQYIQTLGYA